MMKLLKGESMLKRKLVIYSYLAQKRVKRQLRKLSNRHEVQIYKVTDDYDSHLVDDLPLTMSRDPYPGMRVEDDDQLFAR